MEAVAPSGRVKPNCRFAHTLTVRMDSTLVWLFGWGKDAEHKAVMRLFVRFDMLANERV